MIAFLRSVDVTIGNDPSGSAIPCFARSRRFSGENALLSSISALSALLITFLGSPDFIIPSARLRAFGRRFAISRRAVMRSCMSISRSVGSSAISSSSSGKSGGLISSSSGKSGGPISSSSSSGVTSGFSMARFICFSRNCNFSNSSWLFSFHHLAASLPFESFGRVILFLRIFCGSILDFSVNA